MKKLLLITAVAVAVAGAARLRTPAPPEQAAIERISADSMRRTVYYLASDALQGRATPSPGLELAADYIAEQFRRAGLEPAAGGSYFQRAPFAEVTPKTEGLELSLTVGDQIVDVPADHMRIESDKPVDLHAEPVLRLPANGAIPPVEGRIVAGEEARYGDEAYLAQLQSRKPALILLYGRTRPLRASPGGYLEEADAYHAPVILILDSRAQTLLRRAEKPVLSLHLPAPERRDFELRNVVGLLRGSDPVLQKQYLLVTAHYDHLGHKKDGIYPGADDNASGTASVIEIGSALASLNVHPRRTILFMSVFGEEEGLFGSYYYTHHPLEPLKDTVADVNFEQMGRTDDRIGREVGTFAFTGPSYSNLPAIMTEAARAEGISVYSQPDADDFFARSDNYAFALSGVVAHTVAVAFEFPDYHAVGDTADKIDYANMAKVDRGVAAGILELADETAVPRWSDSNAAAMYREAGRR